MQKLIGTIRDWQSKTKSVIEKDAFQDCINQAIALLPTERQQIEDAWYEGANNMQYRMASVYFTSTYKQQWKILNVHPAKKQLAR